MNIRLATEDDLEAINEIYNQSIPSHTSTADTRPYSMKERAEWFFSHEPDRYPVFVAHDNGKITGWVSLSPYRPRRDAMRHTAEISYYVGEGFQRQGIGSALMAFALQKAPEYSIKNLIAILLGHNEASIKLLEKFGFERWGFMPGIADFNGIERDHLYYGLKLHT
ncbi:MAG TPA: GNAT family N-acetyltransferase [Bacteroidales bacterium]|nr:GNAT family N-acetyltransferase [Bacteroidales bacterium]